MVKVLIISTLLCISTCISVGLIQYNEYTAYKNYRIDYLNDTHSYCNKLKIEEVDLISTPIAAALIIFYLIMYKRRVFLRFLI